MTGVDLPLVVASGGVEACVGVLTFGWPGAHEVGTTEETLLVGIADLAAAAIAAFRTSSIAAERAEWAERVSHTDPLTGLSNARTLGRVLELEVARAQRQQSEVSVALFDIDGFTQLNDTAGARAGDKALREVAAVLAETVRLVDTVARTGADEFVLVAPGSAGVLVAKRVLDGIAKLEAGEGGAITVSAGVARFPQDGTDAASLIEAARAALASSSGNVAGGRSRRLAGVVRARRPGRASSRPRPADRPRTVAPGTGSSVSAMTAPGAEVGDVDRRRREAVAAHREVAEGDRRRVALDRPRRVDLRAAGRRETAHRDPRRAVGADHREPRRRPVLAGEDRGHGAGLGRRARAPGRRPAGTPAPRSGPAAARCSSAPSAMTPMTAATATSQPRRDRRRARSAARSTGATRRHAARSSPAGTCARRRRVVARSGGPPRRRPAAAPRSARRRRDGLDRLEQRGRRLAEREQLLVRVGTVREVLADRRHLVGVEGIDGEQRREVPDLVAGEGGPGRHGGPSRASAASRAGDTARPSSRRRATSASRTRLLTVPSGTPVRSAISVCVNPPK